MRKINVELFNNPKLEITIGVVEGSLIISPLISKEENVKLFKQWVDETYTK